MLIVLFVFVIRYVKECKVFHICQISGRMFSLILTFQDSASQDNPNLFINYCAEYKLIPIYFSLVASNGIGNT